MLKLHRLQFEQFLPISPETAWAFFSNPANLAEITPSWLDFTTTSELPPEIYPGLIVTYRLRPLAGITVSWVTEITRMSKPEFFVDEQRLGPYRFWHHLHRFTPAGGGVEILDLVHYALPFGPMGEVLNNLTVRRKLEDIFSCRRRILSAMFQE